jgi:pimeloyl-ACP methyl ester carboxylesterase
MSPENPITRRVSANGLTHHVLAWVLESKEASEKPAPVALLLHGFMDAASTFDFLAPRLVTAGYRVIAPDLRGFGDAPRAPIGSYYHFPEYVADVADIAEELAPGQPLFVVGHSMGGTVASLYAGTFPERVQKLAILEGMGPPDNPPEVAPDRMRRWIEDQRKFRNEHSRAMSREEAERRLTERHGNVPRAIVASRVPHLSTPVSGSFESLTSGDRVKWKFDPLHRCVSPFPFFAAMYKAFAGRITCPVLIVGGGPDGFHTPDEDDRMSAFKNAKSAEIHGAGHMMHWTKPAELAALLLDFAKS